MAAKFNFAVDQGATKRLRMLYRYQSGVDVHNAPVYVSHSLAGCTARMDVKQRINEIPVIAATTENGGITLEADAVTGQIDIVLSPTQTALLEFRKAVYDLELVWPSGDVTRLLEGKITISLNVTE